MYPQSLLRTVVFSVVLLLIFLSQCYWFSRAWQISGRLKWPAWRWALRGVTLVVAVLLVMAFFVNFSFRDQHLIWRHSRVIALAGLWFSSSMLAYLAVQLVTAIAWLWAIARGSRDAVTHTGAEIASGRKADGVGIPRRRFVQTASVVAGAIPFGVLGYGFAIERFRYQVREVDLPVANLPRALDGLRIAQLSDIHMSDYMSAAEVRRAVDMTNQLRADLTVVTGDFITRANDPLEDCVAELSRLQAPLGVWGCNGNHEIYADVEAQAAELFARRGMRLLRQESAELAWHGQPFNLIGVDYQRDRDADGHAVLALREVESQVRRDVPNILLSHNPNSFPRAAALGIELMLAGHTHGGQVRVEILDHRFTPAQFLTPYVAGMYGRPLGAAAELHDREAAALGDAEGLAMVYVNRGLGTIGAPVRLGVPPEISLHTLRRA